MTQKHSLQSNLFNPSDFESIFTKLTFTNLTSKMNPLESPYLGLLELSDTIIAISTPPAICAKGHHVHLKITVKYQNQKVETELTLTVLDRNPIDKTTDRIVLSISQFDPQIWNEFLVIYSKRQMEIHDFFSRVKDIE